MKILLVGEYSRLHNSLKEGLQALGHEVILASTGDHFKKFPSDILLKRRFNSGITKKFKVGIYKIFGIDITSIFLKKQFFSHKEKFKNFDVVQDRKSTRLNSSHVRISYAVFCLKKKKKNKKK